MSNSFAVKLILTRCFAACTCVSVSFFSSCAWFMKALGIKSATKIIKVSLHPHHHHHHACISAGGSYMHEVLCKCESIFHISQVRLFPVKQAKPLNRALALCKKDSTPRSTLHKLISSIVVIPNLCILHSRCKREQIHVLGTPDCFACIRACSVYECLVINLWL